MITPGMMVLAGLATAGYGVVKNDSLLIGLGLVLAGIGGFLWWRKDA